MSNQRIPENQGEPGSKKTNPLRFLTSFNFLVGWFGAAGIVSAIEKKANTVPKRLAIVFMMAAIWVSWQGPAEAFQGALKHLTTVQSASPDVIDTLWNQLIHSPIELLSASFGYKGAIKLLGSLLLSFLVISTIQKIVEERILVEANAIIKSLIVTNTDNASAEASGLVRVLREQCGISEVYEAGPVTSMRGQKYANKLLEDYQESTSVRILMMAGYECFGKHYDGLLRTIPPKLLSISAVVVDPDPGNEKAARVLAGR